MENERPASTTETNEPLFLLTGRSLSFWEANRWRIALDGRRWRIAAIAMAAYLLLTTVIVMLVQIVLSQMAEYIASAVMILLGLGGLVFSLVLIIQYPKKQAARRFAEYESDVSRHSVGDRFTFYQDRVTVQTIRATYSMYFADVTLFLETEDGFALQNDDWRLIIRASDMTPYDALALRQLIAAKVDSQAVVCRGEVLPMLMQPMPIVTPAQRPTLTTARVPYKTTQAARRNNHTRMGLLMLAAVSAGLPIAVFLTAFFVITPYYFVDLAIFSAICVCSGLLIAVGLFWCFSGKDQTLEIQLQEDGLGLLLGGEFRFVHKDLLRLSVDDAGVTVYFSIKEKLFIPSEAVEDMSVFRALTGVQ